MTDNNAPSSSSLPKQIGKIGRYQGPSGWLPLNTESTSPMATHGQGTLSRLIRNQSNGSIVTMRHPSASVLGRDSLDDEERPRSIFDDRDDFSERRLSAVLNGPQMRSQRLIGNSNPRYKWERYWKTEEELRKMKKPIRQYYQRTNSLIQQYIYIDRLLDSSIPHDLLNEYEHNASSGRFEVPATISEEPRTPPETETPNSNGNSSGSVPKRIKRTPREIISLVDAALDFLSTAIVFTTTKMIERQDQYSYPVGRRRLEPIGVLVFSVIMVTSFFQVALECFNRLSSDDRDIIELTLPAIIIMSSTVFIKALCWLWCRLIKNSSVQALAQDAMTDVIFNIFSIIFPLLASTPSYGGWTLSGVSSSPSMSSSTGAGTSAGHIRNLTGAAATADERNVLLYLTMRFARTIKQIQGLQAYHAGDKLNVEVDIVLDESMSLRDSHDLGESLQYVLESVPTVDRAFVHQDYAGGICPRTCSNRVRTGVYKQEGAVVRTGSGYDYGYGYG
ncbi:hypothetical protein DID88_004248 [Monilinia fructigena]|uniref:Cation efflux protein transmembrane domain-containing protein n=1 Tax=Monilinia fructigena TaxID=38457 RepID=A0A395IXV3_9HELO|nr:hypothetical protein DID88_004248 [Monilinia fructigena]